MHVIDSHTGGEPTRVVLSGGPDLGTGSLLERRAIFAEKFDDFLRFIQKRVNHLDRIEATYLTRAWSASRKD